MHEQKYELVKLPDGSKHYYALVEGKRAGEPHRKASQAEAAQPALLAAHQAELIARGDALLAQMAVADGQ